MRFFIDTPCVEKLFAQFASRAWHEVGGDRFVLEGRQAQVETGPMGTA